MFSNLTQSRRSASPAEALTVTLQVCQENSCFDEERWLLVTQKIDNLFQALPSKDGFFLYSCNRSYAFFGVGIKGSSAGAG